MTTSRLLMIEDDARLAGMVSDYLGQNGLGVDHAPDAQSGLARLQSAGVGGRLPARRSATRNVSDCFASVRL